MRIASARSMHSRISPLVGLLLLDSGSIVGCKSQPPRAEQTLSDAPPSEAGTAPGMTATTWPVEASTAPATSRDAGPVLGGDASIDAGEPVRASGQPLDFDETLAWPIPEDHDPDPNVIDITLEARVADVEIVPGKVTAAWTYDGSVPGPLIRATVGQKLIVRFKNSLPEPTSVHWHGLRVDNTVDGVPGVTQPAVESGAEYLYEFTFRDAGTYWYHPHYDSVSQLGRGMYGGIVVTEPGAPDFGEELVLILSDMSIDENGQFQDDSAGGDLVRMFGREGWELLVNGKRNPTLHARAGLPQHWRVINASRSRYYGLGFDGQTFTQVASDGGLLSAPVTLQTTPVIVPGGRVEYVVAPRAEPGGLAQVQWVATDRGFGSTFNRPNVDLFKVQYTDEPAAVTPPLPEFTRDIPALDLKAASQHDIELTIDVPDGGLNLGINHQSGDDVPPIMASIGETQIWNLSNHSDFSHPFHLHGFFFQAIDDAGNPTEPRQWRDTIDVPVDKPVRIAVAFDERPGMWMYHCHILDHSDGGMMGMVHLDEH